MAASLLLVLAVTIAHAPIELLQAANTKARDTSADLSVCNKGQCATINQKQVLDTFGNFFLTADQFKTREETLSKCRDDFLQSQGVVNTETLDNLVGDGDSCCATSFVSMINSTLVNIYGQPRAIIHLTNLNPPQYQFIPHGQCAAEVNCQGRCVIEPTTLTLLIYDFDIGSIAFDFFQVPGYCSCKNIDNS